MFGNCFLVCENYKLISLLAMGFVTLRTPWCAFVTYEKSIAPMI
jgi:hypothetical protein